MFHHRSTRVADQAPFPKIIAATFSAAFDAKALVTWLYVLSVTFVELCPRRSATTFGCSPATSARVAHVWRKSWSLKGPKTPMHDRLQENRRDGGASDVRGGAVDPEEPFIRQAKFLPI